MNEQKEIVLANIKKAAVDAQAYRACQLLQSVSNLIEHKKTELGYPGQLSIDRECEINAEGLLDTLCECLADDPPLDVRQSICNADSFDELDSTDLEQLVDQVSSECFLMFGVKQDDED